MATTTSQTAYTHVNNDDQDEIEEAFAEEDEIDADVERGRAEFMKRRTKPQAG